MTKAHHTRMYGKFIIVIATIAIILISQQSAHAQWIQTNGPYVSYAKSFAAIDSVVFASTDEGVYRTTNGGDSWENTGFKKSYYYTNPDIVTIGKIAFAISGKTIYRSTDLGSKWDSLVTYNDGIYAFSSSGTNLYVGLINGVALSRDSGATWVDIGQQIGTEVNEVAFDSMKIFASISSKIFQTNDFGKHWRAIINNYGITKIRAKDKDLFLSSSDGGLYHYKELDTGWAFVESSLLERVVTSITFLGTSIIVGTKSGVYISYDGSKSWSVFDSALIERQIYDIFVYNTRIYIGASDGVFISSDSGKHLRETEIKNYIPVTSFLINDGFTLFANLYYSTDQGNSWVLTYPNFSKDDGLSGMCKMDTSIFAISRVGRLYVSNNHGFSWVQISFDPRLRFARLGSIENVLLAGIYSNGILRSTNRGLTWIFTDNYYPTTMFTTSGSTVFSASDYDDLHRSTDLGLTWENITLNLGSDAVNAIAADSPYVYVCPYNGISRSTDNGDTFTSFKNSISSMQFNAIVISGNSVIAGNDSGVFISNDRGETWRQANDGFERNHRVRSLTKVGNMLYADGSGVWKRPLSELSVSTMKQHSEGAITAMPNPLNSVTTISFSTTELTPTTVSVFDLLGKEVAVLFNGVLESGKHEYSWNSRNAPQGMYHCVVRMGEITKEAQIVVVR